MAQTVVNPPAAAALVPVAIVSLYSNPGSRKWQWGATNPGHTTRRWASITLAPSGAVILPLTALTTPSLINTSPTVSMPWAGSIMRPPDMSKGNMRVSPPSVNGGRQAVQQSHPDGDAVGDLLLDDRASAVGDLRIDLDALVHRARVHDQGVRPRQLHAL